MEIKAHCKINLGLHVVRRRDDGYHDIETVMMPVKGLFDTVSVTAFADSTVALEGMGGSFIDPLTTTPLPYPAAPPVFPTDSVLELSGLAIDCPPEENICMRALRLVQRECGIGEAMIRLHKAIPAGAGLGGGSADAAAVLGALNREFVLELTNAELESLAARLGSDVPFFVRGFRGGYGAHGGTGVRAGGAQLCTGRGEVMTPAAVDLAGMWLAVVKPPVAVSTAQAYAGVTPCEAGVSLDEIVRRPVREWREGMRNDFEESVFARHPEIGALKRAMYDAGAMFASMSGSGSAVFGIFDERPELAQMGKNWKTGDIFIHIERL
ncbi:MAG: 4-(cytidine 5'-diphospho)-2-C-methyl-D-erythritol kinase [Alistipes sp.]|nr:4-(cytidine 5'-diphospho)-2-C-methyl-D-erythritol kinase [Alistipes sp.]